MAANIRVLGVRETVDNLEKIEARLRERIVRDACRAAADVFAQRVKATTYGTGRTQRTGLMAESQDVRTNARSDTITAAVYMRAIVPPSTAAGFVKGRPRLRSAMPATAEKPTAAFYWLFLERGTKDRRQKRTKRHTGAVSPRPWVGPAFEAEADNAIEAFRLVLARDVEAYADTLPKNINRGV